MNKSEIEKAAEEYCKIFELKYMNNDTPRLSGRDYLVHGFMDGIEFVLNNQNEVMKRRLKSLIEIVDDNYIKTLIEDALSELEGEQ